MNLVQLTPVDLAIAALLVLALAASSSWLRLGVGRDLLVAATRMGLQLTLIGFVLKALFAQAHWYWVALMALVMLSVAGREILARQKRRLRGGWAFLSGTGAVFVSSFAVTLIALGVIVRADPWYAPQYAIPILGMLLGNTMNGIALAVDRLSQGVWEQRALIEQRLMLGETAQEAMADLVRDSLRGGLIPTINAMAVAGIVSLPGMMTGQILAGSPPLEAVKYQILIWLLIAAGTGFGMILAVRVTARRLFDDRDRLRMDRFQSTTAAPKTGRRGSRNRTSGHITGQALVVLGLLMAVAGAVMHFMSERLYTAVGIVEIRKDWEDPRARGPYFLVNEYEEMQSDRLLLPVIHSDKDAFGEALKPEEHFIPAWSRRLGMKDEQLLSEQEALEYLRRHLEVRDAPNHEGVEIAVRSPVPQEAITLFGLVAASYINRKTEAREEAAREAAINGFKRLEEELPRQEALVKELQEKVDALGKELNPPDNAINHDAQAVEPAGSSRSMSPKMAEYLEVERELENQQRIRDALYMRTLSPPVAVPPQGPSVPRVIDPAAIVRGPWRRSEPYDYALVVGGLLVSLSGLWLRSR